MRRGTDPRERFIGLRDGVRICAASTEAGLVQALLYAIEADAVAFTSSRDIVIHAGVVSIGGSGILLPGPSGTGKTTAAALLTVDGFDYLSDDIAIVDRCDRKIHPFPRAFRMEEGTAKLLRGVDPEPARYTLVPPDALREGSIASSCVARWILAPRRVTGLTRLVPMAKIDALDLITQQCFNPSSVGADGFKHLVALVERAACYELLMGGDSATQAGEVVRELVHRAPVGIAS
jgi:hypothetical protein